MPVDVRQLVAEKFVVDFDGVKCLVQGSADVGHILDDLTTLSLAEMKEFRRMAVEHQHRPSWEKLILEEIGRRETKIGNPMRARRPLALTGTALVLIIGHRAVSLFG